MFTYFTSTLHSVATVIVHQQWYCAFIIKYRYQQLHLNLTVLTQNDYYFTLENLMVPMMLAYCTDKTAASSFFAN